MFVKFRQNPRDYSGKRIFSCRSKSWRTVSLPKLNSLICIAWQTICIWKILILCRDTNLIYDQFPSATHPDFQDIFKFNQKFLLKSKQKSIWNKKIGFCNTQLIIAPFYVTLCRNNLKISACFTPGVYSIHYTTLSNGNGWVWLFSWLVDPWKSFEIALKSCFYW